MKVRINSAGSASVISASQKGKRGIGKLLELNREYAILFPKKDNDIVMSGIVGRSADFDSLGMGFVRIPDEMLEVNPETNRISDKSGLDKHGILASILYGAAREYEIQECKDRAEKDAKANNGKIDELLLEQTIAAVKLAYDGAPRKGEVKAIMPIKKRLVSSGIDISLFTEALLLPLDKLLQPEWDNAVAVEVQISPAKLRYLDEIRKKSVYNDETDPDGFLEVKFPYIGADKQAAGKNAYLGVEEKVRKVNFSKNEDGSYVDPGVESIHGLLSSISHDSDTIFSRAATVSYAKQPQDLDAAMRKYLSSNRIVSSFIDLEDEKVKRNASVLIELPVFNPTSPKYLELVEMVKSATEADVDNTEEDVVDALSAAAKDLASSVSVGDAAAKLDSNPDAADSIIGDDGSVSDL